MTQDGLDASKASVCVEEINRSFSAESQNWAVQPPDHPGVLFEHAASMVENPRYPKHSIGFYLAEQIRRRCSKAGEGSRRHSKRPRDLGIRKAGNLRKLGNGACRQSFARAFDEVVVQHRKAEYFLRSRFLHVLTIVSNM
jgi:hypothetical protein